MKRRGEGRKHIVEESVDNIIVSQEITYPPASIIHSLTLLYIVLLGVPCSVDSAHRKESKAKRLSDPMLLLEILLLSTQ